MIVSQYHIITVHVLLDYSFYIPSQMHVGGSASFFIYTGYTLIMTIVFGIATGLSSRVDSFVIHL